MSVTVSHRAAMIVLLGLAFMVEISFAQPPAPKTSVGSVLPPRAAKPEQDFEGRASLPDQLRLGFALDVDGKVRIGDWKAEGTVVAIDNGIVQFRTDDDKAGRFLYRLPKTAELPLRVNDRFVATKATVLDQGKIGFEVVVSVGETVKLLARRSHEAQPPSRVAAKPFFDNGNMLSDDEKIKYWSPDERRELKHTSRYVEVFDVPVDIEIGDGRRPLADGQLLSSAHTTGDLNLTPENDYKMILLESRFVVARANVAQIIESPGYTLEYVMIRKEK